MHKTREVTNKILEAVEEGLLNKDMVIMACLKYMSEDDVRDMADANCFFEEEEEEETEYDPMEDFNYVGSRHHY
jgi:flagellar biosynthesis/type III secretory pathway M-ring protein FliF/YscJ